MPASSAHADALAPRQPASQATEVVMPFTEGIQGHASAHEHATREHIARRVAQIGIGRDDKRSALDSRAAGVAVRARKHEGARIGLHELRVARQDRADRRN